MMEIYNTETNSIHLEDKSNNIFNIQIRGRITIVNGESATGKTLLCTRLQNIKKDKNKIEQRYNTDNIFIANEDNADKIAEQKNKLIVIDRAEYLLTADLVDYINNDESNRYLIFTRKPIGIRVTPNHFAEFKKNGNEITATYAFDVKGWC